MSLEVRTDGEAVWLNRAQIAELFDRDVKTIGKHIANAKREELYDVPVVAKFATTATDGNTRSCAALFVTFLANNNALLNKAGSPRISNNALVALTLPACSNIEPAYDHKV